MWYQAGSVWCDNGSPCLSPVRCWQSRNNHQPQSAAGPSSHWSLLHPRSVRNFYDLELLNLLRGDAIIIMTMEVLDVR